MLVGPSKKAKYRIKSRFLETRTLREGGRRNGQNKILQIHGKRKPQAEKPKNYARGGCTSIILTLEPLNKSKNQKKKGRPV